MMLHPNIIRPEQQDAIVASVREGNYPGVAAQLAGIPLRTWELRVSQGRDQAEELGGADPEPGSLAHLAERIQTAQAEHIASRVKRIRDAGDKPQYWAASMTLLERLHPDMYGRRTDVRVQSETHVSISMSPGTEAALLAASDIPQLTEGTGRDAEA